MRLKPRGAARRTAEEVIDGPARRSSPEAVPGIEIEFVQLLQDMIGDLEGAADADRGQDLRRRSRDASPSLAEQVERELEEVPGRRRRRRRRSAATPRRPGRSIPSAAGRARADRRAGRGPARRRLAGRDARPTCACSTAPSRCACAIRTRDRFDPARLAPDAVRGAGRPARAAVRLARPVAPTGDGELDLQRENLRQMALVTGRLEGRDLGSAVAEIQAQAAPGSSCRSATRRGRRPVRVAAAGLPRAAAGLRHRRRAGASSSWSFEFRAFTPALLILLAAPLSLGGALPAAAARPAPSSTSPRPWG